MDTMAGDTANERVRRGVAGVIVRQQRFLAIRRSSTVVAPRTICFPGGAIEAGESQEQALEREFREELNVAVQPLRRVWRSTTPWQVELEWWLAALPIHVTPMPNPAEVEAVHWMTAQEMLDHADLLASNRAFFAALAAGEIVLG
jgi:8-oxo-dGTP diphosphatase